MNLDLSSFIPLLVPVIAALCTFLITNPFSRKDTIEKAETALQNKISPMYLEVLELWGSVKSYSDSEVLNKFNQFIIRHNNHDLIKTKDSYIIKFILNWPNKKVPIDKIIEFSLYVEKEYWSLLKITSYQYTWEKLKSTQHLFFSITTSMFKFGYYIWYYLFTFLTWVVVIILYLSLIEMLSSEITFASIAIYILVVMAFLIFKVVYVVLLGFFQPYDYESPDILYKQLKNKYTGKKLSIRFRIFKDKFEQKLISVIRIIPTFFKRFKRK
ncbi:hypothetical protein [Shouchella lehensis]|uniref:Uncharacterized protein n=1 Tax=Shouchella lehensis G1 TaxID=1246626 RepID=A0A060LXS6_9BACI|nr:hypothetical protein [Shouchella lehensis]AIC93068.1 hypothetical protein BleG1_0460 [Shouchella lehensis G1]